MSSWLNHRAPRYLMKPYFWVCLWRCFCMSVWINRPSKDKGSPHCWGRSPSIHWARIEQNGRGGELSLSDCVSWNFSLQPQTRTLTIGFQTFRIGLELDHWLSWASSLQTADSGVSQPPLSCEPIPYQIDREREIYIIKYEVKKWANVSCSVVSNSPWPHGL